MSAEAQDTPEDQERPYPVEIEVLQKCGATMDVFMPLLARSVELRQLAPFDDGPFVFAAGAHGSNFDSLFAGKGLMAIDSLREAQEKAGVPGVTYSTAVEGHDTLRIPAKEKMWGAGARIAEKAGPFATLAAAVLVPITNRYEAINEKMGARPIVRGIGFTAFNEIRDEAIKAGAAFAVFVNGTREPDNPYMTDGVTFVGAAMAALDADLPLVPMGMSGAPDMAPKRRLRNFGRRPNVGFVIGEPMYVDKDIIGDTDRQTKKLRRADLHERSDNRIRELILMAEAWTIPEDKRTDEQSALINLDYEPVLINLSPGWRSMVAEKGADLAAVLFEKGRQRLDG